MTSHLPETLEESLMAVEQLIDDRLAGWPDSPYYQFAKDEMKRILHRWKSANPFDEQFYDELNIGVMCARELESRDMEFCNHVYRMLTQMKNDIRSRGGFPE